MSIRRSLWLVVAVGALTGTAALQAAVAATAREMYAAAMSREKVLRAAWEQPAESAPDTVTLKQARAIVSAYEAIVRRYPTSGYCDNALWQAAALSADAFTRSAQEQDRRTAVRLFEFLAREYPTSPFAKRIDETLSRFAAATAPPPTPARTEPAPRPDSPTPPAPPRSARARPGCRR